MEDLGRWEEGGERGLAPGRMRGGTIDVPAHSVVYYTYEFEAGTQYALFDDVNGIEKRFTVG